MYVHKPQTDVHTLTHTCVWTWPRTDVYRELEYCKTQDCINGSKHILDKYGDRINKIYRCINKRPIIRLNSSNNRCYLWSHRQTDRQTGRHTDRCTNKQTDKSKAKYLVLEFRQKNHFSPVNLSQQTKRYRQTDRQTGGWCLATGKQAFHNQIPSKNGEEILCADEPDVLSGARVWTKENRIVEGVVAKCRINTVCLC